MRRPRRPRRVENSGTTEEERRQTSWISSQRSKGHGLARMSCLAPATNPAALQATASKIQCAATGWSRAATDDCHKHTSRSMEGPLTSAYSFLKLRNVIE